MTMALSFYLMIIRVNKIKNLNKNRQKNTGISEYKLKQSCIDQNNVEWNYVVDSARIKLSESGKLLEEGQS